MCLVAPTALGADKQAQPQTRRAGALKAGLGERSGLLSVLFTVFALRKGKELIPLFPFHYNIHDRTLYAVMMGPDGPGPKLPAPPSLPQHRVPRLTEMLGLESTDEATQGPSHAPSRLHFLSSPTHTHST